MPDLLIELLSEEIPARMQPRASEDLKRLMTEGLVEAGLNYEDAAAFATPRRLTLAVHGLSGESPKVREERKGPRVDAPEKALEGFLRSTGLTRGQLEQREDKKGTVWFATIERAGRPASEIVSEVLGEAIRGFPWPKSMSWGAGQMSWVRPLHTILAILSDETGANVVPFEFEGIAATDTTTGHRFMSEGKITVTDFDGYTADLKRNYVVLDPSERAEIIQNDAMNLAFASGLELIEDAGLLREVAGLVEWPVVLMGDIAADFLDLPAEVLQTSMREHQKFFSVKNPKSDRIEKFITVANRETVDGGATILAGNQKVLAARLADAKYFWENDLRVAKTDKMQPWLQQLKNVTFHAQLGSQAERIDRIANLACELAPAVGADPNEAFEAASIAKADLASEMVYEFPELQGTMARYYAEAAGFDAVVAAAAEEHWGPLGPSDDVPTAPVSVAVALADKVDTLTGFWRIDEKPTGSKDPFALRRAALGVIRIVLENDLSLSLPPDLLAFFHDRLKVYLRDRGIRHDVIDAVLVQDGSDDLSRVAKRAEALQSVLDTDDGENLVQGFKRANNILKQAEEADGVEYSYGPDRKFIEDPSETALFDALETAEAAIEPANKAEDFAAAMSAMAALRGPVDAFFEAVQVNSENAVVRRNRLNLLNQIRQICSSVADLSRIEGG